MEALEQAPAVLRDIVRRFEVCWEVRPEHLMVGQEMRQIGFALELYGTHRGTPGVHAPGCPDCQRVFSALHVVAGWILPREKRPSYYELSPFHPARSYSPARGSRVDIALTVKILHRQGYELPVDDCELRCLQEMRQRLVELGAQECQWTNPLEAVP